MLGRYELLEQVGSGGMAVVYRGRDSALDREVAVKLLHPHLAGSAESRARFAREARAVARLAHPGIVEIFDYAGDGAPEAYLVTEFIRGRTLRAYAQQVGFAYPEVGLLVGRALCEALVHAHSAGVIHRDLKPENVLVQEGARPAVKLADFGIARILASDERMTMTGALVGSPHHMAPEIVEGREADARSDLFSLGTILYWLATGRFPFAAGNPTAILRRAIEGDFDDPREVDPRVSNRLADLVRRCLMVEPADRPASAAEVREALDLVLAEVGLVRPEDELVALLSDPAGFKEAFPARAVAALLARGDAALAEGASARALSCYDRVLALDPANAVVPGKLRALSRRRRLRRLAGVVAALALLGAAGVGVAALWRSGAAGRVASPLSTLGVPAGPAVATSPGQVAATLPDGLTAPGSAASEPPRAGRPASAGGVGRPVPGPGPSAALTVFVRPYAQRALLDGTEVASGAQVVRFEIGADRPHTIQVEHACCAPFVRQLSAAEAAAMGELRVPLVPRPARLRVEGDPATRVLVEGVLVGTAGESQHAPLAVAVPAGGDNPYEATVRIVLEPPGGPPRSVPVKLRAGGEVTVATPTAEATP
ncbi:MAG: serine/threonine protein kinase [Anaeromyxobacter sp.]|nr:serine/threonine protein kinase [Anaeromyxobacter sp.]MBL0277959.1 serine/threonine protein kinase [Anaeromyxobacter sp.]